MNSLHRRLIASLIVLALTFTLSLFAREYSNSHGTNIYAETLTIDVFDSLSNYQGIQSGWFAKLVLDKFNIKLNIITPYVAGGGDTIYQTRTAAGELGDLIICDGSNRNLQDLVTAGLVMDMQELLKDKDIMQYELAIRTLNDPISDTAIYAIPSEISLNNCLVYSENEEPAYGPYLRYDLYTAIGSPRIGTLEDLLDVLQEMQNVSPVGNDHESVYGFSLFKDLDSNMLDAARQLACLYGYDEYGFVLYKADGSDQQSILAIDSVYQRILKFYFDANQRGLLDPASLNQTYQDVYHKCTSGSVLFSCQPWLGKSAYNTEANMDQGSGFMFVPIEDMQILLKGCLPLGDAGKIIAIGTNAEDPARLAAFIDWLYSPEGIYANSAQSVTGTAGPEDLTWAMTEHGPALTDFGLRALSNENPPVPDKWGSGTWNSGISRLNFNSISLIDNAPNGYPYYYTLWDSYKQSQRTALELTWKKDMKAENSLDYLMQHDKYLVCPGIKYQTSGESLEISTLRRQCRRLITDYSWQMIFAPDEETFYLLQDEMRRSAESLGYDQVLEEDLQNVAIQNELRAEAIALLQ